MLIYSRKYKEVLEKAEDRDNLVISGMTITEEKIKKKINQYS